MGLFRRPKPMPQFVLTPEGWRPLQEVMHDEWRRLAATAWEGHYQSGRGFLKIDFSTGSFDFIPISDFLRFLEERGKDEIRKSQATRQLQDQCSRYKPDREIIVDLRGARDAKAARAFETEVFVAVVTTPPGLPSPPHAYEMQRMTSAAREHVSALQQQRDQVYGERSQKGLDSDIV
jgi:hypothetical protein